MKAKYLFATILVAFVVGGVAHSNTSFNGWPFSSPVVAGESSVVSPEAGNIILDNSVPTFKGYDGTQWINFGAAFSASVPAGSILPFGGTTAPTGYLLADGSAVSRSTYSDLFAAIGTAYGNGDGSTTFNLPDLRGRFLRGVDGGSGRDPDVANRTAMAAGGNTGNNVGSIQLDEFEAHTHTYNRVTYSGGGTGRGCNTSAAGGENVSTTSTGGNETRPVNAYVNYIVKY